MPARKQKFKKGTLIKKRFKELNNGLNPAQVAIINAPFHLLIKEFKAIQKHESKLSSLLRLTLETRVKQLVELGQIDASELDVKK